MPGPALHCSTAGKHGPRQAQQGYAHPPYEQQACSHTTAPSPESAECIRCAAHCTACQTGEQKLCTACVAGHGRKGNRCIPCPEGDAYSIKNGFCRCNLGFAWGTGEDKWTCVEVHFQ